MAKLDFDMTKVLTIVALAVFLLYILGTFMSSGTCSLADVAASNRFGCESEGERYYSFEIPDDMKTPAFSMLKLAVVFAAVFVGYAFVAKLGGGALSRRDFFTIALIAIGLYLLWDNVLKQLFEQGKTLDNLTFAVGQKLGILK